MKPKIVVFTGAGMSADSGLSTFRDSDGLWANHRVEDICTHEALDWNRAEVIRFYNERRREILEARPNAGHLAIARLAETFPVEVITQNIDDLHERAGSRGVVHLHGEARKLCSTRNTRLVYPIEGWEQPMDAVSPDDGALLRPFIVFFGEAVPELDKAVRIAETADIFVIVGTSLAVYPAASLIHYIRPEIPVYVVDPKAPPVSGIRNPLEHIAMNASKGVPVLVDRLIGKYAG